MVSATATSIPIIIPDNAPTVGNVLPVILVAVLLSLAISAPWWRRFLPDFYCCGCLPCIVVHEEGTEEDVPSTVRFTRVDDAIGVSKAPGVATQSCSSRRVPDGDESFWSSEDDEPSWLVDGASASDGAGPSAPSDGRVMDLEVSSPCLSLPTGCAD